MLARRAYALRRKSLPLLFVVLFLLSNPSKGDTSACSNSAGVTAPCGPGNSDCNASAPPPLPRYHVIDYSCGENDPNGPCYNEQVQHGAMKPPTHHTHTHTSGVVESRRRLTFTVLTAF